MQPILSTQYDGRPRWLYPKQCKVCSTTFYVPKNQLNKRHACSKTCRGKLQQRREAVICGTCHKPFERAINKLVNSKSGVYFCSRKCKDEGQRIGGISAIQPAHYGMGLPWGVRLIRERGRKCERCGNTAWLGEPIPLERHHVDGDTRNNAGANIKLLCPNCHAMTPNYRGRNKGHPTGL